MLLIENEGEVVDIPEERIVDIWDGCVVLYVDSANLYSGFRAIGLSPLSLSMVKEHINKYGIKPYWYPKWLYESDGEAHFESGYN